MDCAPDQAGSRRFRMTDERLVLHGSFTSSSTYKPMLFLALAGLPFSFRTVNLKNGVQKEPGASGDQPLRPGAGAAPSRPHPGDVQRHPRLPGAHDGQVRGRDRAGSLARPGVAVVGERRHHKRGPGPPFQPLPHGRSRRHELLPPAGGSGARHDRQAVWKAGNGWSAKAARSPTSAAGAAWCSWPRAACRSTRGPTRGRGATG